MNNFQDISMVESVFVEIVTRFMSYKIQGMFMDLHIRLLTYGICLHPTATLKSMMQ